MAYVTDGLRLYEVLHRGWRTAAFRRPYLVLEDCATSSTVEVSGADADRIGLHHSGVRLPCHEPAL